MKTKPRPQEAYDVVVMGEILLEVATDLPFAHGVPAQLGVSGDALNVAASAAAAGARVGLLAVLTDDDLGQLVAGRVAELGISTALLRFRPGQQGIYLLHCDPSGQREFSYARAGSVGSTLGVGDVDPDVISNAGAVIAGGICCAIAPGAQAAVVKASHLAHRFVFDPNFRPRLTDTSAATANLLSLAPRAFLVTPSFPGETSTLLDCSSPAEAAAKLRSSGAANVAVTCGAEGVQLEGDDGSHWIDAIPAPAVVDQTGAGDAFVGTMTARFVLGDSLADAARYGAAAASLVIGGKGGTDVIPSFEQTRAHADSVLSGGPSSHV